jgi:DNA sulfur modification protein DndD
MLVIAAKQREIEPTVKKLLEERDILTSRASLLTMFMTQNHCPVCGSTGNSASDENHSKLRSIQDEISEINRVLISQDPVYLADYEDLLAKLGFSEASYTEMKTTHKKITRLKESIARKKMELSSLIERLPVTNMEVSQRDNLSRYESLTRRIAQDEILLGDLDKEIESLQQSLLANRAQIVKNQTITSKPAKAMSFYSHLHGLLVRTIEIYAQNVRSHVEREASTVFSQIISEKEFESLQINSMFGMEIVKIDKSLVSLRSEGQAHIAAISLVAGLLKTAIKDGFILMDTPFGRLDMTHRENICHWIVDSGLQVALFVHSGEFRTEEHMHLLNGKVGRQYQIQRLDSNRSQFKELI